jgi:hypothetical protein
MNGLDTREAFKQLIYQRGIHHKLDLSDMTIRSWRRRIMEFPDHPTAWGIPLDRMESLLIKAGHQKIQETLWR